MPEAPFSDLIQRPTATVTKLYAGQGRSLRLRRRDDEDLVLTTAAPTEQDAEIQTATNRMLVPTLTSDPDVCRLVTSVIPTAFPWVRFLSRDDYAPSLLSWLTPHSRRTIWTILPR